MKTIKKSMFDLYRLIYQGYRVFDVNGKRLRYADTYYWQNDHTMIDVAFDFERREYTLFIAV